MRPAIPIALLLLLAGCSAPTGGPTDAETPEPTPTPTTPNGATVANTVAHGNLSAEARSAFDAAVDGSARFAPDSPYVEDEAFDVGAADVFGDNAYVVRDGAYYAVSLEPDGYVASYQIRAERSAAGENASVVALQNVSAAVRDEVRSAVENGSHSVPPGKWNTLPPALSDHEFVRYEDETYHLAVVHGDLPTYELTVRRIG